MNKGFQIVKNFKRADEKLVNLFKDLPVANIDDNMNRTAAIDASIRPLNEHPLLGTAFTVSVAQGDNLMFHKAMDMAKEGDVIVIEAGGFENRAIFGGLMATYCRERGIKGIVVDGAVRDVDDLRTLGIPIYAKAVSPNGPYKNGPGTIGLPITVGGQLVNPGDIMVGDQDGIVVVPPEVAENIARKTKETRDKETAIEKKILEECSYIRPWVDELLEKAGCEYIEGEE